MRLYAVYKITDKKYIAYFHKLQLAKEFIKQNKITDYQIKEILYEINSARVLKIIM